MGDRVSRRALLRGGAGVAAGAAVLGGPFRGFVALAERAPTAGTELANAAGNPRPA